MLTLPPLFADLLAFSSIILPPPIFKSPLSAFTTGVPTTDNASSAGPQLPAPLPLGTLPNSSWKKSESSPYCVFSNALITLPDPLSNNGPNGNIPSTQSPKNFFSVVLVFIFSLLVLAENAGPENTLLIVSSTAFSTCVCFGADTFGISTPG